MFGWILVVLFSCMTSKTAYSILENWNKQFRKHKNYTYCTAGYDSPEANVAWSFLKSFATDAEGTKFTQTKYIFTVQENSPVSTIVGQVKTSGPNEELKLLGADYFSIENPTGNILTTRTLDYETQSHHTLLVVTAGRNSPISSATVVVDVIDVNEAPEFSAASYHTLMPYDVKLYSSLLTITAFDEDTGLNGLVEYSIKSPSHFFAINPHTGQITLTKRHSMQDVSLTVQAIDHGIPSMTASANVMVSFTSGTLPPRTISSTLPKTSFDVNIMENTPVGANVLSLAQHLMCSPVSAYNIHNSDKKFRLSSQKSLQVSSHLDFETISNYDIMITTERNASCAKGTPINVRVHIQDANDYPPMLFGVLSPFRVPSSVPVGTVVYVVNAWDGDKPNTANSRVVYAISSGRSDVFSVSAVTGELRVKSPLTTGTTYRLRLQATDHGYKPLMGFTDLEIEVVTLSTGLPEFASGFKLVNVQENLPYGTIIDTIVATPKQSEDTVLYSIIGSSAQQLFTVNTTSGVIKTQTVFDRETTERTALIVRATNQRDGSLNSDLMINVVITDDNDNPPVFPFRFNTASVPKQAVAGRIVYQAKAYDVDSQSQMVYSIIAGNDDGMFEIQHGNNVVLKRSLEDVSDKTFDLTLSVSDGRFNDSTMVRVQV